MQPTPPSPLASLFPIAAIFVIFYFLLIRPQQKRQKELEAMLKALKKGDRVLTNGGLYGVVAAVKGDDVELRIADEVKVLVSRASVASLAPEGGARKPEPQSAAA